MKYLYKKHWEQLANDLNIKYSALQSMFKTKANEAIVASKELSEDLTKEFPHNPKIFDVSKKIQDTIQSQAKKFI